MGPVLGWSSTTSNEEADIPPFSPFQSWDSTPSVTSGHSLPPSHPPRTMSFPTMHPSMHRHTVSSMTSPASLGQNRRTSNSPSDRRARHKREEDPNWVPRPLNSFMVFRVEYSRQHAQEQKSGDVKSSSVAEKTLSKRASEAWKKMSAAERQIYKDKAEEIKAEHSRLHPNYRYKPRRKTTKEARPASVMSRREQVVSFMERVGDPADFDFDHSPPEDHTSLGSSSPEPPELPRRVTTPTHSVRRRRSCSLPTLLASAPDVHTYLLEPETVHVNKRARSGMNYPLFTLERGMSSSEFGSDGWYSYSGSPVPSSPDVGIMDNISFDDGLVSVSSGLSPQTTGSSMMPDIPGSAGLGSIPESSIAPQLPLVQRRQRSNTTSAIPPSPLSLVSSSLAGWNGVAAASTSSLPTWGLVNSSPGLEHSVLRPDALTLPQRPQTQSTSMLTPGGGILSPDLESQRTPRMAEFPADIQSPYMMQNTTIQSPGMVTEPFLEYPSTNGGYEIGADLEAYAAGLEALNIMPETYDILSPPDELNFSDLFHVSP